MAVRSKGDRQSFQVLRGVRCSRRPVIDAVNGGVFKPCLEPVGIFPQIMQQPGQSGFIDQIKRGGKFPGESGHIAQMRGQELPLARGFW